MFIERTLCLCVVLEVWNSQGCWKRSGRSGFSLTKFSAENEKLPFKVVLHTLQVKKKEIFHFFLEKVGVHDPETP